VAAQRAQATREIQVGKPDRQHLALPQASVECGDEHRVDVRRGVLQQTARQYAAGYQAMREAMGKGKAKSAARTHPPAKKALARRGGASISS
jgi:hypothetical protein